MSEMHVSQFLLLNPNCENGSFIKSTVMRPLWYRRAHTLSDRAVNSSRNRKQSCTSREMIRNDLSMNNDAKRVITVRSKCVVQLCYANGLPTTPCKSLTTRVLNWKVGSYRCGTTRKNWKTYAKIVAT